MIILEEINDNNIERVLDIYNSNREFLLHHLGKESVDKIFIKNEMKEMKEHGFNSNLISYNGNVIGVIDYGIQDDGCIYLSLLMLSSSVQKKKLGTTVYKAFEGRMIDEGAKFIRIDVVNDYEPNVIQFWEKMGFVGIKEDVLTWGNKTSKVLVMTKTIQ